MRLVNIFKVFRFLSLSWLLLFSVETMAYLSPVSVTVTSDLYGKIALSWTGLAPGGGWTIYRSTTSGVLGTAIKTGVTNTSYNNVYYEDKSAAAATPSIYYYYTVKDGASNSSYQYSGKSVYAGPSGLIATSSAPERIDLSWTAYPKSGPFSGVTYYSVFRSTSATGSFVRISDNSTSNKYTDYSAGSATGQAFWYKVKAYSGLYYTDYSVEASGMATAISPPTGLSASQSSPDSIELTWQSSGTDTVDSGLSYNIYRSTSIDGTYELIDSLYYDYAPSATKVYYDFPSPGSYWYKITAVETYNNTESAQSVEIKGVAVGTLPSSPADLTASTTHLDRVDLTWTAVSGASYKVYRATSSTGTFVLQSSPTSTNFADTTSVNGTSYWYTVSAVTNGNEGSQSASVTGKSVGLPATPAGLTASTAHLDQVDLTWSSVSGASYKVYRGTSSTGPFVLQSSPTGTSFADTTTVNDTSYWYTVSAVTNGNEGSQSAAVAGKSVSLPSTPSGLTASTTHLDQVDLTWTAVSGASYKVYRATSSTGPFTTPIASPTSTSFADTTSVNGTSYWYVVSAVTNGNEGAQSASVTGKSVGLPATPAGLTASTTTLDQVNLTWGAVSGASYKVYRGANSAGPFSIIALPSSNSFSDTEVVAGTPYWYAVSAVVNDNEGAQSPNVSGSAIALPGTPSGLTATQGTTVGAVGLSWGAVANATGYGIYRDGAQIGVVSSVSFDDALLDVSVHGYVIAAIINGLEGAQSSVVTGYAKSASLPVIDPGTAVPVTPHYKIVVRSPK